MTTVTVAAQSSKEPTSPRRPVRAWSQNLPRWTTVVLVAPLALVVLLFVVYPLIRLVINSFTLRDGGLSNYAAVFSSPAIMRALGITLLMAVIVTTVCAIAGLAYSWTLMTTRSTFVRALLWAAVLLPFWMGVVVKAYAWQILLAYNGVINSALVGLGLSEEPLQMLYTSFAVTIGMVYTMLPYAVLSTYPGLAGIDRNLVRVSDTMGAHHWYSLLRIWLPLARPTLIASSAIVFAISIGFYVTPILLGGAQTPFIASIISDDMFTYYNSARASATSVVLLVIALAVLAVALKLAGSGGLKKGLAR